MTDEIKENNKIEDENIRRKIKLIYFEKLKDKLNGI